MYEIMYQHWSDKNKKKLHLQKLKATSWNQVDILVYINNPSIHLLSITTNGLKGCRELELILAGIGRKAGYTLDKVSSLPQKSSKKKIKLCFC